MNRNHPLDDNPPYPHYYPLVVCGNRQQLGMKATYQQKGNYI